MITNKTPRQLLLYLLTAGASLTIGLLSFGGMLALSPILPLALGSFVLAVAYEGEIYLQNIKGALNKLFKKSALERQISNQYLLNILNNQLDTPETKYPPFLKDYQKQLQLVHAYEHQSVDNRANNPKKQAEKTLRDMEKWFATQLFATKQPADQTPYETELLTWLETHDLEATKRLLAPRRRLFVGLQLFSALAGTLMSMGTSYLLMEAFTAIPFLSVLPAATWPLFIVPMALVAGSAYGFLTYNAVTDMVSNNTLSQWYQTLKTDFKKGLSLKNVFIGFTATLLVGLAVALTICTAGTWWTVVQETPAVLSWLGKMPRFVMGVLNPLITGLSSIVFNLQNSAESLEIIYKLDPSKAIKKLMTQLGQSLQQLKDHENIGQRLNPFRILLMITITPLRIVLFLGHLISIGVTADRVPGMPQVLSALLGIISEGFEDFHYFSGHEHEAHEHHHEGHEHHHEGHEHCHEGHGQDHHADTKAMLEERLKGTHGHNHDLDLPTRLLKLTCSPIYFLATCWDYLCSQANTEPRKTLRFKDAWDKQTGVEKQDSSAYVHVPDQVSQEWKVEHAIYRIERHQQKELEQVWIGSPIAQEKHDLLTEMKQQLQTFAKAPSNGSLTSILTQAKENTAFKKQRFFPTPQTKTEQFLNNLEERIDLRAR